MTETKITTKLISTKDSQATVEATIDKDLISKHKSESIKHMSESITLKGFRKGKAPLNLVEDQLDPQKVTEHTLNHLLPEILSQAVKENDLKVIGSPHLRIKSVKSGEDWSFEIDFPLLPVIELGDYQKTIKELNATPKLWSPKDGEGKKDEGQIQDDHLSKVFDLLLKDITFTVPRVLIDEEVDQSLSRLIAQTEKLGLKLEDYLKTLGKTSVELRADYEKAATENLKLELILEAVAQDLKINATEAEIVALVNATADPEAKKKLDNPRERDYIRAILRKRKTIDALLKI